MRTKRESITIRLVTVHDTDAIADLLAQLGYTETERFLASKISMLMTDPHEYCMVAEDDAEQIVGFISIHIITQIALKGDFARISYFVIDKHFRGQGIGTALEAYGELIARKRNCDLMEVHCHTRRDAAYQFYHQRGYKESPKYLIKRLN